MERDWDSVAAAINARMSELGMKQVELAERSGMSVAAIRLLQKGKAQNALPRTLANVSEALGWPREHLAAVRDGRTEALQDLPSHAELVRTVRDLQGRVDALERRG